MKDCANAIINTLFDLPPGKNLTARELSVITGYSHSSICKNLSKLVKEEDIIGTGPFRPSDGRGKAYPTQSYYHIERQKACPPTANPEPPEEVEFSEGPGPQYIPGQLIEVQDRHMKIWVKATFIGFAKDGRIVCENAGHGISAWNNHRRIPTTDILIGEETYFAVPADKVERIRQILGES